MNYEDFLTKARRGAINYQSSNDVKTKLNNTCLLIVVGPSGAGKSTLIKKSGIQLVPSVTTRDKRLNEVDGQDMIFEKDYAKILNQLSNGEFVQVALGSSGDFYATLAGSYPDSGWAAMPIVSDVVQIFRNLGFKKTTSVFIVPPSFEEWQRRMSNQGLSNKQLAKRLVEAKRSFEFALHDNNIHFVLNDNIDEAVEQLKKTLSGELDKEREEAAKQSANQIYKQLTDTL